MSIRIARGYEKIHHPYQELYEGVRPSIQGLRAAKFLAGHETGLFDMRDVLKI